jgi:hypothetical protein
MADADCINRSLIAQAGTPMLPNRTVRHTDAIYQEPFPAFALCHVFKLPGRELTGICRTSAALIEAAHGFSRLLRSLASP